MSYTMLFNHAHGLALRLHQHAALYDLPMMNQMELIGAINLMARMENS